METYCYILHLQFYTLHNNKSIKKGSNAGFCCKCKEDAECSKATNAQNDVRPTHAHNPRAPILSLTQISFLLPCLILKLRNMKQGQLYKGFFCNNPGNMEPRSFTKTNKHVCICKMKVSVKCMYCVRGEVTFKGIDWPSKSA